MVVVPEVGLQLYFCSVPLPSLYMAWGGGEGMEGQVGFRLLSLEIPALETEGHPLPSSSLSGRETWVGAVEGTNLGWHQNPQYLLLTFPPLPHEGQRSGSHRPEGDNLALSHIPQDSEVQTHRSFHSEKVPFQCSRGE